MKRFIPCLLALMMILSSLPAALSEEFESLQQLLESFAYGSGEELSIRPLAEKDLRDGAGHALFVRHAEDQEPFARQLQKTHSTFFSDSFRTAGYPRRLIPFAFRKLRNA